MSGRAPRALWYRDAPPTVGRQMPEGRVLVGEGFDPYILAEQMRAASCTRLEQRAVVLFLIHRRRAIVARRLRVPFQLVTVLIRSAIEKLAEWRAHRRREDAFEGWKSVYISEVNRWAYPEERHCLDGEEACAKNGLCPYRWYLYRDELL